MRACSFKARKLLQIFLGALLKGGISSYLKNKTCIFVVWWYVGNIESSGGHSEALAPQFFCEIRHKPTNHPGTESSNHFICGSSHSGPGFPASLPLTHIPRLAIMTVGAVYAKGIELLRFRTSRAMLLGMTWNEREKKNNIFLVT